jgi:microsomal dipeptidase-like Zn-dependent dipeptidase
MVVTHALQSQLTDVALTAEEIIQLARGGAFIEHSFWAWMPTTYRADPKHIAESVKATGARCCVMSSDFGQYFHPPAPEGLRLFIATMLRNGLEEKEIELMVKTNPAKLLGLD